MFGTPVSLNFKGETSFKTTIGGVITIISIIVIIIFLGIFTNTLFSRDDTNLKFVVKTDNLADKSDKHLIGLKGVYFAIYDRGSSTSIIENKAYIDLKIYQATTFRDTSGTRDAYNTTLTELSTSECNRRFYSNLGISTSQKYDLDNMICTDSLNYAIGGNSLSSEYNYIHIVLTKWTGQSYWKSDDEIPMFASNIEIVMK